MLMLLLIHAVLMPPLFYVISSTTERTMKDIFIDDVRNFAQIFVDRLPAHCIRGNIREIAQNAQQLEFEPAQAGLFELNHSMLQEFKVRTEHFGVGLPRR